MRRGALAAVLVLTAAIGALGAAAVAKTSHHGAVQPRTGKFSGFIGPGSRLSFTVSSRGTRITKLRSNFEGTVNCGPPANNPASFGFPELEIHHGQFSGATTVHYPSGLTPRFKISGHFTTPSKASGTMNVHFTFPHNALPPCNQTSPFSVSRSGK
jgi:hypothetical protein